MAASVWHGLVWLPRHDRETLRRDPSRLLCRSVQIVLDQTDSIELFRFEELVCPQLVDDSLLLIQGLKLESFLGRLQRLRRAEHERLCLANGL